VPASPVLGLGCRGEERRDQVAVAVLGEAVAAVFIFLYFIFLFFIKIYFRFGNLHKYTRCRSAGIWPPGSRAAGAYLQKKLTKNCAEAPGRPAAGRRVLAARLRGDRRPAPHPSFASLKIQKKRKEREGEEG